MRQSCYALARAALRGNGESRHALADRLRGGVVIGCDFDGTLCRNAWPGIGEAKKETIEALKLCISLGAQAVLWSCRELDALDTAVNWCAQRGLHFAAVNNNTQETIAMYGVNSRKISVDEYWDDKAVVPEEE